MVVIISNIMLNNATKFSVYALFAPGRLGFSRYCQDLSEVATVE